MENAISVLVGAAVTWFAARYYYKRAGDELKRESALLQKAVDAVIALLEHREQDVTVHRDRDGRVTRIQINVAKGDTAHIGLTERADVDVVGEGLSASRNAP